MPENENAGKRLILADGTILEGCECGYSNKMLWCFLNGISFAEAFQYFSNSDKFNKIIFEMHFADILDRITYSNIEQITAIEQGEFRTNVRLEGSNISIRKERIFTAQDREEVGE